MFRLFDCQQGSDEWLAWRKKHGRTTATMPAVIMGKSPYCTANQLWREMVLGEKREMFQPALDRGKALETPARLWAEQKLGCEIDKPICVEHYLNPLYAASLDGCIGMRVFDTPVEGPWIYLVEAVVEIKVLGAANHAKILSGEIPEHYAIQIKWQIFVTGAKYGLLVAFDGIDGIIHRIEPFPPEELKRVLQACAKFHEMIDEFREPDISDADWAVEESEDWAFAAQIYKEALEQKRQAENLIEAAKAGMEKIANGRVRLVGCGLKYYQTIRSGPVDYKQLCVDKCISSHEVDQYRKDPIVTTNVRVS
jgi:putative phage-type endonuclease